MTTSLRSSSNFSARAYSFARQTMRVVEVGAWGMVLVVETDLELGPELDHQGKARLEALISACQARLKRDAMGVQRIRLVKASR